MKANELMIGDWVMVNDVEHTHPLQVAEIFKKCGAYYATLYWDGMPDNVNPEKLTADIDKVLPIPLTPEILEKNGFVLEEYKYVLKYDHYVEVWVIFATSDERHSVIHNSVIHIDDDRERIPTTYHNTIKYVNELQHAFKLCKIDKKIEL